MNIIYLRVSTNESRQDVNQQLKAILEKYQLKEYEVYKDEGSAYDIDKIHRRTDFLKLLDKCFKASETNIKQVFTQDFQKKDIHLYVWDSSRIMRNLEHNVHFYLLGMMYGIHIHSYREMPLNEEMAQSTTGKLMIMVTNAFNAYNAHMYSEALSGHIKKAYDKDTHASPKGLLWGSGMTPASNWKEVWSESIETIKGELIPRLTDAGRLRLLATEKHELDTWIVKRIKKGELRLRVIDAVEKEWAIKISQKYLSTTIKNLLE